MGFSGAVAPFWRTERRQNSAIHRQLFRDGVAGQGDSEFDAFFRAKSLAFRRDEVFDLPPVKEPHHRSDRGHE